MTDNMSKQALISFGFFKLRDGFLKVIFNLEDEVYCNKNKTS